MDRGGWMNVAQTNGMTAKSVGKAHKGSVRSVDLFRLPILLLLLLLTD